MRIQYIPNRVIDRNGISDGAELFVYQAGTTTKVPLFSDDGLTQPIVNPFVAPVGAEVPTFYTSYAGSIRLRIIDRRGNVAMDEDPYLPPLFDGDLAYPNAASTIGSNDNAGGVKWTTVAGFISYLFSSAGSSVIGFIQAGSGAVYRLLQDKARETVSVLDYGPAGNGGDDTATIMAAVNANKGGTIVLPGGKVYNAAGIILSGSSYDGTRIVIEGVLKMLPNPNPASGNFQIVTYCCIVFHDCDGCSLAVRGWIHGNRTSQPASQQNYQVMLAGVTNFKMDDGWTVREIRGDAVCVTHKDLLVESKNSDSVYIGTGMARNTSNDGRNAVSILSGTNINVQGGISSKVGGIINGERMPGGFDCEPDHDRGHYIENLTVGFWTVETIGTSGFAVIGASMTNNDSARDWNIKNVQCAGSIVKHTDTTGLIGGQIFRRLENGSLGTHTLVRASRSVGIEVDYCDRVNGSLIAQGCSTGVTIGFYNFVNDATLDCKVNNHSASAVLAVGINYSTVTVTARTPQGAGSYGLNLDNVGRVGLSQTGVQYTVNCPFDPNLSFAIRCGDVSFGYSTSVEGGALLGYPNFTTQLGAVDPAKVIPTFNVKGRNFSATVPTTGTWASDDFVKRIGIAPGTSPGWYNTAPGTAVWKSAAVISS